MARIVGKEFGQITVQERVHFLDSWKLVLYCSCGVEISVREKNFVKAPITACRYCASGDVFREKEHIHGWTAMHRWTNRNGTLNNHSWKDFVRAQFTDGEVRDFTVSEWSRMRSGTEKRKEPTTQVPSVPDQPETVEASIEPTLPEPAKHQAARSGRAKYSKKSRGSILGRINDKWRHWKNRYGLVACSTLNLDLDVFVSVIGLPPVKDRYIPKIFISRPDPKLPFTCGLPTCPDCVSMKSAKNIGWSTLKQAEDAAEKQPRIVMVNGAMMTFGSCARLYGITESSARKLVRMGKTPQEAIDLLLEGKKPSDFDSTRITETKDLILHRFFENDKKKYDDFFARALKNGLKYTVVSKRLLRGWSLEDSASLPRGSTKSSKQLSLPLA